jgi:putative toxin-antitoxin system antitoxin component (TIGR02293 family)
MNIGTGKKAKRPAESGIVLVLDKSVKRGDSINRMVYLILGGKDFLPMEPSSAMEYITASWKGIPKLSLENLSKILSIPMKDIAVLLNVSYKTIGRKGRKDLLDPLGSSLSIEMANIAAKGISVFEDSEKFKRWLQKENRALGSKRPIDLLNTPTGIKLVHQVLERLEEGVYT